MASHIHRIKACLNGVRGADEHPALPLTSAELAADAAAWSLREPRLFTFIPETAAALNL